MNRKNCTINFLKLEEKKGGTDNINDLNTYFNMKIGVGVGVGVGGWGWTWCELGFGV